ncbi:MAG: hypothetical protein [Wendovervirus sonii]|uniref:Leucine rich repeat protein n=1 Tax=phage Lak_Megaphage_Sonny TaxID=3109229 RepID=A0ABZ0Z3D0_9CAUD|nr:MAG: hypothetical protein [phage Lak_Megaphage_Sonny]
MATGGNYIITNGEVKALTGSTASGNANTCCTNAREIIYGAYPARYTNTRGQYCAKASDTYICTNIDKKNCNVNITTTPESTGLKITATATDGATYRVTKLTIKKTSDSTVIASATSSPFTCTWSPTCDFNIVVDQAVANNKIYYTSTNSAAVNPSTGASWGGANIDSSSYSGGQGVIVFDRDLTTVGANSFNGCSTLKTITLPSTVTSIGSSAFKGTGLTGFTVPSGVTAINANTFQNCTSMTSVTMHNSITSIGNYAFDGCSHLGNIAFPSNLTTIGQYCFRNCTSITSLTLPSSITTVGTQAFYDCTGMEHFSCYPISSLGNSALMFNHLESDRYNTYIKALLFYGTVNQWHTMMGGSTTQQASTSVSALSVICNNGLLSLDSYIVSYRTTNNTAITSSTFQLRNNTSGACVISSNSIYNSTRTDIIGLVKTQTIIDYVISVQTTTLKDIAFPLSVKSFSASAFSGNTGMVTITFGNGTPISAGGTQEPFTSIGTSCFNNCTSLTNFNCYEYSQTWNNITLGSNWSNNLAAQYITCFDLQIPLGGADRIAYAAPSQITFNTTAFGDATVSSHTFINGQGLIKFNKNVSTIGTNAFNASQYPTSAGMTSITLPSSLTSIGISAFSGCTNLQVVNFEDLINLQSLGNQAFLNCTSLFNNRVPSAVITQHAKLPASVTTLGDAVFSGCTGMTRMVISNCTSLTSIGANCFKNCSSLTSMALPQTSSTLSLGSSVFEGCTGLTSMNIPNKVTTLSSRAFYGCTSLSTFTMTSLTTSFGTYCFYNTSALRFIEYSGTYAQFDAISKGSNYAAGTSALAVAICLNDTTGYDMYLINNKYIAYRTSNNAALAPYSNTAFTPASPTNAMYTTSGGLYVGLLTFTGNVTAIGNQAFYSKSGYTKMIIPSTVTSIGSEAFRGCSGLTSLPFKSGVTTIGQNAFQGCNAFTSVTIPNSVTTINGAAFQSCTNLTTLTIGSGVSSMTDNPFSSCTKLSTITVNSNTYFDSRNNCNAIMRKADNALITGCKSTTIPSNTVTIGSYAFANVTFNNTSITLPSTVTTIQANAFMYTNIVSIDLKNTKTIGASAFYQCTSLKNLTLSYKSGMSIGSNAFANCNSLVGIVYNGTVANYNTISGIPSAWPGNACLVMCTDDWVLLKNSIICYQTNNNTAIAPNSTTWGTGITSYDSNTYNTDYSSNKFGILSFSGTVTQCGLNAFKDKTGYTKIRIPTTCVTLGNSSFRGCTNLTSLNTSHVTYITEYTFAQSGFTSITLGTSISSLPQYVFYNCTSLSTLTTLRSITTFNSYACAGCTSLSTINYGGTIAQYSAATRADGWHTGVPVTIVIICTNGTTPIDPASYELCYSTGGTSTASFSGTQFYGSSGVMSPLSNTYNSAKGCCVLTFSSPVTSIQGSINDESITEITIPSTVTDLDCQITCIQLNRLKYDGSYNNFCNIDFSKDEPYNMNMSTAYVICNDNVAYMMPNVLRYENKDYREDYDIRLYRGSDDELIGICTYFGENNRYDENGNKCQYGMVVFGSNITEITDFTFICEGDPVQFDKLEFNDNIENIYTNAIGAQVTIDNIIFGSDLSELGYIDGVTYGSINEELIIAELSYKGTTLNFSIIDDKDKERNWRKNITEPDGKVICSDGVYLLE